MYDVPAFVSLGQLFSSSDPIELTEAETEYVVTMVKHCTAEGDMILQFSICNTVSDQVLTHVSVELDLEDGILWQLKHSLPCPVIRYGETHQAYLWLAYDGPAAQATTLEAMTELKFKVVEITPDDNIEGTLDSWSLIR